LAALLAGLVLRALLLLAGLVLSALLLLTGFVLLLARLILSALLRIILVLLVCHRDVLRYGNPPPAKITRNASAGSSAWCVKRKQHLDTTAEIYKARLQLCATQTGL
jgi:hypothetical protein